MATPGADDLTAAVFILLSFETNPWGRLIKYTNNWERRRKTTRRKGKDTAVAGTAATATAATMVHYCVSGAPVES